MSCAKRGGEAGGLLSVSDASTSSRSSSIFSHSPTFRSSILTTLVLLVHHQRRKGGIPFDWPRSTYTTTVHTTLGVHFVSRSIFGAAIKHAVQRSQRRDCELQRTEFPRPAHPPSIRHSTTRTQTQTQTHTQTDTAGAGGIASCIPCRGLRVSAFLTSGF